ncbi:MAG: glycosyl hydrolase family 28-related protein [Verrucomicrobiota bacterium]
MKHHLAILVTLPLVLAHWAVLNGAEVKSGAKKVKIETAMPANKGEAAKPELQEVLAATAIPLSSLGNQKLAAMGFVDVTAAPFNADATGKTDATAAIQKAIFAAREHQMVLFFPVGVYRVSDTLRCPHGNCDPADTKKFRSKDSRNWPCVLMGSRAGKDRPRILLAPKSPGYGNPARPKYVIQFWSWAHDSKEANGIFQDNINMNQMLIGIDVAIGEGNPGAVGVRCRGAQGTSVQDCTIDATHGYSGLEGGAGSGGGHFNVTILGGQIGADLSESQPAPTIAGFTLRGQTKHAILYNGRQTLTAVGCRIEYPGSGAAVMVGGERPSMPNGQVSMIDCSLALNASGANAVFSGTSSLYLNNVFVKCARRLADWGGGQIVELEGDGWTCVREYAHGRGASPYSNSGLGPFTFTSPVYVDGNRLPKDLIEKAPGNPPPDLLTQHIWGNDFPSWEQGGAVNVKNPPYNATGDGKTDDFTTIQRAIDEHETVFLPKGHYKVSHTLHLKPATRLIGLHPSFATIEATGGGDFENAINPRPVVATADDSEAHTVLAFASISTGRTIAGAYALDWRAGRRSIFRSANIEYPRWRNQGSTLNVPLVLVAGNGGGRWYNFFQESWLAQGPNYRHLLVKGTHEPLAIYQCNPEHARSDANMEVCGARYVSLYGVKSEGNQPVISVRDSDHIRIFGYGGNAAARAGTALFTFENTPNFLVANLIDSPRFSGGAEDHFSGMGVDPQRWQMLREKKRDSSVFETKPLERPVLVKQGMPRVP